MLSWFDELLKHDGVAVALITAVGTILVALITQVFGGWKWLGEQIAKALEHRRQAAPKVARLPKKTMLLAESNMVVKSHFWQIQGQGPRPAQTGFKAFLVLSRLVPYTVGIIGVEARLPWRFRLRHRVIQTIYDPLNHARSALFSPQLAAATEQVAVNFYVEPPIVATKPITATVRIRDQFRNWHSRKVTFHPQP